MRTVFFSIALTALLLACCGKETPYDLPEIEGKNEQFITKKYGMPEYEYSFHLSDTLLEYRYGLLSKFEERGILIKEKKFNQKNLTIFIWFYKKNEEWLVATSLFVPEGIQI